MTKANALERPFTSLHDLLSGDEDARACRDISESACREQPRSFGIHLVSQSLTKIGDGMADAKLVLSWLLDTLGAPGLAIALLVPVRESLALLPQLIVAGWMRTYAIRKWFWVAGSATQGASLLAMAAVAALLQSATGAWLIVGLLALFSLARGVCSVAAKDVFGKTIAKQRRGTLSGYAATAAGVAVIALGLLLQLEQGEEFDALFFIYLLTLGGSLWLIAAGVFALLEEYPGATDGGASALRVALASLRLVREDEQLRMFLYARALLVSTALLGPFFPLLSRQLGGEALSDLGILVLSAGIASSVSASVWGRWSDWSSRRVMATGGALAAVAGLLAATISLIAPQGVVWASYAFGALYFVLTVAHTGVRLGRKTHLIDIASSEQRASYVAVSNTLIGIVLLAGASIGIVSDALGPAVSVLVFSLLAAGGALTCLRLTEAQR